MCETVSQRRRGHTLRGVVRDRGVLFKAFRQNALVLPPNALGRFSLHDKRPTIEAVRWMPSLSRRDKSTVLIQNEMG